MPALTEIRPLEFRLAPEYRRCGVYVAFGAATAIATLIWLKVSGLNPRPWENVAPMIVILAVGAVGLLAVVLRYRLRADGRGVWRRRLLRWDLWPWEAFEGGRVRHGRLDEQLTFPEKGRYWRTISWTFLAEQDRQAFAKVVDRFRTPSPPPALPEVVTVRFGLRSRLDLTPEGMRLMTGRRDPGHLVPWAEVVKAELLRVRHDRPDFVALDLWLPGRDAPVSLRHSQGRPLWSGADAEVIALYLRRHLDDGRLEVTALRGPPADDAEAARRLARLEKNDRVLRRLSWIGWGLFAVGIPLLTIHWAEALNWPNPLNWRQPDWAVLGLAFAISTCLIGPQAVSFLAVIHYMRRSLRRERAELFP